MNQLSLNLFVDGSLYDDLNPEQVEAVTAPIEGALQIMAGAGTGKTELITRRFAKLVLDLRSRFDDDRDVTQHLWVSTFTEKAAQEMKSRIAEYLMQKTGIPLNSRAWIGTFHSLCHRLLQQNRDKQAFSGFLLLSDVELELLREELLATLLDGIPHEELEKMVQAQSLPISPNCLTLESLLKLDFVDYRHLFEEILLQVIPRIKASGLQPQDFYYQAMQQTKEYANLIASLPVSDPYSKELWTDHSEYAQQWCQHLDPIRHSRFSFFPTDWDIELAAQKAIARQKDCPDASKILIERLKPFYKANCFVAFNGRRKSNPFSPATSDLSSLQQAVALEKTLIEMVTATYLLYQQALQHRQAMDYDDLIQESNRLLSEFPSVRDRYQAHFAHFMVDEFQDSNGGQLQLIQLLNHRENPCITAVGDRKQSIYGFRFAEPENLQLLFKGLSRYHSVNLQTNYRSERPILEIANRITEMMLLEQKETLLPAPNRQLEEPVQWLYLDKAQSIGEARAQESRWIAETIAKLVMNESWRPGEIAVLVRDHGKALQIEEALESLGIPAVRQRNLGFFRNPIIQQAVALLEIAQNPDEDFALINLLQRKLTHRELYLLARQRQMWREQGLLQNPSYFETLCGLMKNPEAAPQELAPLLSLFRFLIGFIQEAQEKKRRLTPDHFFDWMLQAFPLISPEEACTSTGQKALKQLELLKRMMYYWSWRISLKAPTLESLLELIKRYQVKNELELPLAEEEQPFFEEAVRILTVHGAKGLQFPVVFVAGADNYRKSRYEGLLTIDPQYPGKMGVGLMLNRFQEEKTLKKLVYDVVWKIPRSQEEELRLFYVAVTRAKNRLFLSSWPKSFPYMNPAFFADPALQRLSPDMISWKSTEERAQITQKMNHRFRQCTSELRSTSMVL